MTIKRLRRKPIITAGIDPGANGFLVVFNGHSIVFSDPMPYKDRAPAREALFRIFKEWREVGVRVVALEQQHAFWTDTPKTAFSVGRGFGTLETALTAPSIGLDFETYHPSDWKKKLGITVKKGTKDRDTVLKQKAIEKARSILPTCDFRKSPRATKPHHGKAEAFLLAYLAHEKLRRKHGS